MRQGKWTHKTHICNEFKPFLSCFRLDLDLELPTNPTGVATVSAEQVANLLKNSFKYA